MVEIRDGKKVLITPVTAQDLEDIKVGDIIYLDGSMTTCRDVAHRRLVEEGRELPVDVRNNAIFHAGPIIRPLENDKFQMVSVGPTTSMRMEKFEYEFVKLTGVRVIIGKGGMKENTERACKEFGAIHCVFPAGNAVVAATEVEEIVRAEWRDLGMPETLWNCRVKEFGPLIVSIDTKGNNMFEENKVIFNERKDAAYEKIAKEVVEAALDFEKCPYEAEVNVILTDNDAIQAINKEYRQIDAPTDVLSFPMVDYEKPSDFDHVEDAVEDYFNPETGELMLGDIVISVDKVEEQAEKYGHSQTRELAFLVAHSMLHLCGYDHMVDEERLVMEDRQRQILDTRGYTR